MRRRIDALVYPLVIRCFRVLFAALGLRITVSGGEHLPRRGGAVLAANHTSFLDFALVGVPAAALGPTRSGRLVRFMAKVSTFTNPVSGPLMRAMQHIAVDRDHGAAAYRRARRAVARDELVGVFPEATISRSWTLKPFKPGAAAIAIREQVPLIPVIVWGAHRLFTVDGHRSLRRGTTITITVGEPIRPAAGADIDATTALLRARMTELLDAAQRSYPDRPRGESDRWWLPRHLGGSAPTPERAAELDAAALIRRSGSVTE